MRLGIGGGGRRGFTLLELMAVVAIITILLVTVIPALDNVAPSSRLDAGGRYVAGTIELAQSEAISQRKEFVVAYDLDNNTYWIILPEGSARSPNDQEAPPEEQAAKAAGKGAGERPEDDLEHGLPPPDEQGENNEDQKDAAVEASYADREAFEPNELPAGIVFESVVVGDETHTSGRVYVTFDHRATQGAHMVGLQIRESPGGGGASGQTWLRFDPLTRTLTYSPARPEVPTLEEE